MARPALARARRRTVAVPVAEPPDRLDSRIRPGELATQPHDAVLDPVRADAEWIVPDQLEKLARGERLARVPDQRGQQPELDRRQRDRRAVHPHLVRGEVHAHGALVVDVVRAARPRAPQQRGHPGGQLRVPERLGEVVVGAAVQAAHLLRFPPVRGQDEDRHVAQVADALKDRPAVEGGQPDVEDDEVRAQAVEGAQALPAVGGTGHLETAPAEDNADAESDVLVVFDQQHAAVGRHRATGRKTLNVLPSSRTLSTSTCPPCISTSALTMDRPRPDPGRPAVRALDARTNGPKSRAASSAGMPIPASDTSIRHLAASQAATTKISPSRCENLTALPTRLSSTWSSRR